MGLNESVLGFVEQLKERCPTQTLECGATVIDCGVTWKGSVQAGLLFANVTLAGLAEIQLSTRHEEDLTYPVVEVRTDHPTTATIASQMAGWQVVAGKFFGMGSGPARALALKPKEVYEAIDRQREDDDVAVLCLEASSLPSDDVAGMVAEECGIKPRDVHLLVARTDSITSSVQLASRTLEMGTFRMLDVLKFDVRKVVSAFGVAPLAPVYKGLAAMGATNDALIYGGDNLYFIDGFSQELTNKVVSADCKNYGKRFEQLFKEAGKDFYKMDHDIFAPAKVTVNDLAAGKVYSAGRINLDVLREVFAQP
ncbi:MAG: methenyltetrahydromethanopterin cyclohydrolase [Methanopyri archaeon]|jgi:methenyltetrahydromethanopterin cyclohydrolase|nr:methenyltetrahydromethanopterin cyclohydrolase [Methanopyri archaeon]